MGQHPTVKPTMFVLFPEAFVEELPEGTHIDDVVLDVSQKLISVRVPGYISTGNGVYNQLWSMVDKYFHPKTSRDDIPEDEMIIEMPEEDEYRYDAVGIPTNVIICFDTPGIPSVKGFVQQSRDSSSYEKSVISEQEYCAHVRTRALAYSEGRVDPMIIDNLVLPEVSERLWRTFITRGQLTHFLTSRFACDYRVPPGKKIVIDEGFPFNEEMVQQVREIVANKYGWEMPTSIDNLGDIYKIESETYRELYERSKVISVSSDQLLGIKDPLVRGEFDCKACAYVRGSRNVLIESQDSDLMMILVLRLIALGDTYTGELWLDALPNIHKPGRTLGQKTPRRYVNIRTLKTSIEVHFSLHYPEVRNPVETFVALSFLLKTDFTETMINMTNIGVLLETLTHCGSSIQNFVTVYHPTDPPLYMDCTRCYDFNIKSLYYFYLLAQEVPVLKTCNLMQGKKLPMRFRMEIPDHGTPEVIITARYFCETLEAVKARRAKAKQDKNFLFIGENRPIVPIGAYDEDRINDPLYELRADHPILYYHGTYGSDRSNMEKLISNTPEKWSNMQMGIQDLPGARRYFRSVLWAMNYYGNPLAGEFADRGWASGKSEGGSLGHWGWSIRELEESTAELLASSIVMRKWDKEKGVFRCMVPVIDQNVRK